jgi:hypothetical protein
MKIHKNSLIVLFVLLAALLLSSCEAVAAQPVEALGASDATPEAVSAPPSEPPSSNTDVAAPLPTEPAGSAFPAGARIEFPVENASMKMQILDVEKPHRVYLGWDSYLKKEISFMPGPGNMFLSFGVKLNNLTSSDINMKWSDLYLVNKYDEKWYPEWGAYRGTNSFVDPRTVEIVQYDRVHPDFDPDAHFYASNNGFVRVIFRVPKDNLYYFFGFAELPIIEINWRYY